MTESGNSERREKVTSSWKNGFKEKGLGGRMVVVSVMKKGEECSMISNFL